MTHAAYMVTAVLSDEGAAVSFRAWDTDGGEHVLWVDYDPAVEIAAAIHQEGKAWVIPAAHYVTEIAA